MKAIWNEAVLASSDDTVLLEGNPYFPRESLDLRYFEPSERRSVCPWKGTAHYFTVKVGEKRNVDAAWYYPDPTAAAEAIRGRVAFWRGVEIRSD